MYIAPEKVRIDFSSIEVVAGTGGGTGGTGGSGLPELPTLS